MAHCNYPFVVAGRNPRPSLRHYLMRFPKSKLVESPSQEEMDALIAAARCTMMITRQPTGFKLKLVNSLVRGQHCLVNTAMVAHTDLAEYCHVADTAVEMRQQLDRLMQSPFDDTLRQSRLSGLERLFDNADGVRRLLESLHLLLAI